MKHISSIRIAKMLNYQQYMFTDMIRTVLFIAAALLAIPLGSHAQEEMFPTGMTWEEIIVEPADKIGSKIVYDTLASHIYKIDGDTIVGQKAHKKVECDGKPYGELYQRDVQ